MRHPFRFYLGRVLRRLLMLLPASMLGAIPQPLLPAAHAQGGPDRPLSSTSALNQEPAPESEEEPPPAPCIEPVPEVPPAAGPQGTALERCYSCPLGIAAGDIVAFGDMPNDVPMLRWSGLGVAMGNAHPDAVAAADEVTTPNTDDGLARVLERWWLA